MTFSAALEAVPFSLRAQPVLNEYGLGGQLIFNGVRPFIDSRADLYGDEFLARYRRIDAADRAELERTLSEYHITWTIFPASHPVVSVMDNGRGGGVWSTRMASSSTRRKIGAAVGIAKRRRRVVSRGPGATSSGDIAAGRTRGVAAPPHAERRGRAIPVSIRRIRAQHYFARFNGGWRHSHVCRLHADLPCIAIANVHGCPITLHMHRPVWALKHRSSLTNCAGGHQLRKSSQSTTGGSVRAQQTSNMWWRSESHDAKGRKLVAHVSGAGRPRPSTGFLDNDRCASRHHMANPHRDEFCALRMIDAGGETLSSALGVAPNPAIQVQHAVQPVGDRIIILK